MKVFVLWCVVTVVLLFIYESNKTDPITNATPEVSQYVDTPSESQPSANSTFDGYTCTVDCGGHEAGYRWAEKHDISDEDTCDTAGDNSNSPSFAEGCKAFVNGDSDQTSN